MKSSSKLPVGIETRRCAIYTRKSTTMGLEQDFNSLDAQREACLSYIQRQPGWVLVDERYDDGGFTGANIDRPAFQRLMLDIEQRKIDAIIVYKVDRLSRSLLDFAKVMERLGAVGASFVSVTQNFSTADAMGKLILNMLISFAEFEREMIGERTRDKIAGARRKGKWTGGAVPFGYRVKDKRLVVDEFEAFVVREAFELLLEQKQKALVARTLNERHHVPRVERRPKNKSPVWTKDSIGRLLRKPIYAGLVACRDGLFPGEHEAIVDTATYHRAQAILDGVEWERGSGGINPAYVLRGLLHCGQCKGAMTPGSTKKGATSYRYYRCATRDKHGRKACAATALPANAIEEYVAQHIAQASVGGMLAKEAKAALNARIAKRREELGKRQANLPSVVAAASANMSKWVEELSGSTGKVREVIQGKLHNEEARLRQAEQELLKIESELAALDGAVVESEWVEQTLADFGKVWEVMTPPNRTRLLRALVDRIVVDEAKGQIEVRWVDFGHEQLVPEEESKPAQEQAA